MTSVPIPESAGRFYRHGWHSWSPAAWVGLSGRPRSLTVPSYRLTADDPEHLDDPSWGGSWVGAVDGHDDGIRLLGTAAPDSRVTVSPDGLVGQGAGPWFEESGPELDVFAGYARHLGDSLGRRSNDPGPIWCSWYSYYRAIDSDTITAALAGLESLPFSVFQVDDGWQRAIGDWVPGDGFAAGMEVIADQIAATGRRPGLWLAPLIAHEDSEVVTSYPEFVLRDASGDPVVAAHNWGGDTYALDTTHPGALEHILDSLRRAVAWGFSYLKLDFLYAGAMPGRRHVDGPREASYRLAIEAMRRAVGDDVYLLACGAPIVPSIGLFDGTRVGPDVAPYWEEEARVRHLGDRSAPGAADAITTSLNRLWLKDVIAVDPDVVFFRTRFNLLSPEQRSLLRDLAHVCGFRATSDPPDWLDASERAELTHFLEHRPAVERTGAYRFELDGREVDFTPVVAGRPT